MAGAPAPRERGRRVVYVVAQRIIMVEGRCCGAWGLDAGLGTKLGGGADDLNNERVWGGSEVRDAGWTRVLLNGNTFLHQIEC
jgi:hypothetical protein